MAAHPDASVSAHSQRGFHAIGQDSTERKSPPPEVRGQGSMPGKNCAPLKRLPSSSIQKSKIINRQSSISSPRAPSNRSCGILPQARLPGPRVSNLARADRGCQKSKGLKVQCHVDRAKRSPGADLRLFYPTSRFGVKRWKIDVPTPHPPSSIFANSLSGFSYPSAL